MVRKFRGVGLGAGLAATLIVVSACSASPSPSTTRQTVATPIPPVGPPATTAVSTNPPVVQLTATPTPAFQQRSLWVGNTDGQGVFLRRTPQLGDKLSAYIDGTLLRVVGPEIDSDGTHWQHVVAPDGKEGFVPAAYALATQVPTVTPVPPTATPVPSTATKVATSVAATRTPLPSATSKATAGTTSPGVSAFVGGSSGGCGSRGGPGYRKANGQCASWRDAGRR